MQISVIILGVSEETWFRGSRDERTVKLLNCADRKAHLGVKFKASFDYSPTKDEQEQIDFEKLDGETVTVAVEDIKANSGGRLKMKGMIDRSTLPKGALRTASASAAEKTPATAKV